MFGTGWARTSPHSSATYIPLLLPVQALAVQHAHTAKAKRGGPKRGAKANARSKARRSLRTPSDPTHPILPASVLRMAMNTEAIPEKTEGFNFF